MTASPVMPHPNSPWPKLQAVHGRRGDHSSLLNAAIAAEVPGGSSLLDALKMANETTKWDDATVDVIAGRIELALRIIGDAAISAHLEAALEAARSMPTISHPRALSKVHALLRDELKAARVLVGEAVLQRYRGS